MISTSMDLTCDERPSDSPFIQRIWRSHSKEGGAFISMAECHWEMVVTRFRGKLTLTVRGPETKASPAYAPEDAEFFGIQFKPGTLMPLFPAQTLMDRCDINLPSATNQSFWLHGSVWQFPNFENAETFVEWLVHDGLIIHDPLVANVLQGQPVNMSLRSIQRRFLQATGLTHNTVHQIERARYATMLLKQGASILDTVHQAGYADQPHLTRSLKHRIGQTPAQIISDTRLDLLSFLFKTKPF